jgi:hypothetical protein
MSIRNFSLYVVVIACFILISTCLAASEWFYEEGEVLVKFAPKVDGKQRTVNERNEILSSFDCGELKHSYKLVPGWSLVKLPANMKVKDALPVFKGKAEFIYVEPNYKIKGESTDPNDQNFDLQWGLHNTGSGFHEGDPSYPSEGTEDADIDAPEAWDIIHDANDEIVVAVIDSGVDYYHSDLSANMWLGNAHHGYDFSTYGGKPTDDDPMDDYYHGTHCAGIIGALGNNGIGVCGVCWHVKIMAVKFMNWAYDPIWGWGCYGKTSDAIAAIEYAVNNGAKILSNSWEISEYSQALKDHIDAADANGVLFITSAGNDGENTDFNPHYPSSYDCNNIISVMATNRNDVVPSFSNYGPNTVDIAAPGLEIYSTMPTTATTAMINQNLSTDYDMLDGTSMAAPYVSGACALVWSQILNEHPNDCNYMNVKATILNTAEKLPVLTGKCATEGRLNLDYAIRGTIPIPQARNITQDTNDPVIQNIINDANDDDEIVLDKGSYYQNFDITSSDAKRLTIRSIDPNNPAVVANTFIDSLPAGNTNTIDISHNDLTLQGLTIRDNGYDIVNAYNSSTVTISTCKFTSSGCIIICAGSSTVNLSGCSIQGNRNSSYGVSADSSGNITVRNCLIHDCLEGIYATGIHSADIRNCTIVNNADEGIHLSHNPSNSASVRNCIVWDNGTEIYDPDPNVAYCCVQDGFQGGTNIITDDPCFVAPDVNDFHLRFDSNCINAGNPNFIPEPNETDIDGDQRVLGRDNNGNTRVDIGADEYWAGDFNVDGIVNFKDFARLANVWNASWSPPNASYDPYNLHIDSGTQYINYEDLEIFVSFWLTTSSSYVPEGQGEQMQGEGLGEGLELESSSEMLLEDEFGDATISLACDVNDPNENEEITVYVYTDSPLWLFGIGVNVIGDANITAAMSSQDCNEYGWDPSWLFDPTIDDPNGYVETSGVMFSDEGVGPGDVGYIKLLYHSGLISLTFDWGVGLDIYGAYTQFSTEPLYIGRDPNE